MKQQTAIEWVIEQLPIIQQGGLRDVFNQAKAMEELQIQLAKQEGYNDGWLEATQYIMKYDKKQEDGKE